MLQVHIVHLTSEESSFSKRRHINIRNNNEKG